MDSYVIARAESRIRELEFEVQRLKGDVQRMRWTEGTRLRFMEDFFSPMLWVAACCILGTGLGAVIGTLIKNTRM